MSLPGNQSVLPPPSNPTAVSYGDTAIIDALNSNGGYDIDLTTTEIGAFIATVPCIIRITPGVSTQAVWIKNTSGNQTVNVVVECVGGTIDGKPTFGLNANGQFTIFTGDGAGNLTTS
jgi:hypothetical protein